MACVAPQTRKYWMDALAAYNDVQIIERLTTATDGLERNGGKSERQRHDWTIFRACVIREARRRGLSLSSLGT